VREEGKARERQDTRALSVLGRPPPHSIVNAALLFPSHAYECLPVLLEVTAKQPMRRLETFTGNHSSYKVQQH